MRRGLLLGSLWLGISATLASGGLGCRSRAEVESRSARMPFINMVRRAVRSGAMTLDLRDKMSFEWDRLIALPPQASPEEVNRRLGFAWPEAQKNISQIKDQFLVLVFVKDKRVVAWFDLDRERTSVEPLLEQGYIPRSEAVFTIRATRRKSELHWRGAAAP
jgi:hypothetical protein